MNIENMEKVIAAIEQAPDKKFDMREWVMDRNAPLTPYSLRREAELKALIEFEERGCGTSACVVGWALVTLLDPDERPEAAGTSEYRFDHIMDSATKLLGLSEREASWLFMGNFARDKNGLSMRLDEITKVQVLAEMRRMVAIERVKESELYQGSEP